MTEWKTAGRLQSEDRYGRLMVPEVVTTNKRPNGQFRKGSTPWNKGKTWDEMGIGKRNRKKMLKNLELGRTSEMVKKARSANAGRNKKEVLVTVIATGKQVCFESASSASIKMYGYEASSLVCRAIREGYLIKHKYKVEFFNEEVGQNDLRNFYKKWRQDDINYIKAHMDESNAALAKKFGRKANGISSIKSRIRKAIKDHEHRTTTEGH